ncbi:MAG: DNA polymerase III subunit delta' [Sphingomonadaceae bacterium]|nr:DNA polymerase III subunit delta' [Sphingomonadaceae bacterium]
MSPLFGHDAAIAAFRAGLDSGRLHHAWLLAGPKGVGKASFADKAALRVLASGAGAPVDAPGLDVPDEHPAARLIAAGSHPDHVRLERLVKDSGTELARSINVDQVRGLQRLFATTPSMSPWRTVVIDAIDDLETGGANALLKNLEEPPPSTVFLLVSHAPERLLPTIRSRCRLLRFSTLDDDAMTSALRGALSDAEEEEEIAALARVGEGAPGRAIAWRGLEVEALDREMDALVREGDRTNARRAALAQSLALKSAQPRYEAFLARAPSRIAAEARRRRGPALAEALALWERAVGLAGSAQRLSLDAQSTVFELAGMLAALAPAAEKDAA